MARLSNDVYNQEMVFLDKYGWPIECTKGHKLINFIRLLIHTCKIKRGKWNGFKVINERNN